MDAIEQGRQAEALCARLMQDVRENREWLLESLRYPLAPA